MRDSKSEFCKTWDLSLCSNHHVLNHNILSVFGICFRMSIWAAGGVKSDCRSLVGSCCFLAIEIYCFEQGMQTRRLCISITGQNKRPAGDVGDYIVLWHHKGFSEQCVLVHNFIKESKQRCNRWDFLMSGEFIVRLKRHLTGGVLVKWFLRMGPLMYTY